MRTSTQIIVGSLVVVALWAAWLRRSSKPMLQDDRYKPADPPPKDSPEVPANGAPYRAVW